MEEQFDVQAFVNAVLANGEKLTDPINKATIEAAGWLVVDERRICPALETESAEELMKAEIPPISWAVNDLFPAGLCVIAASPKIGKSWLALDLAICVACGRPFWGRNTQQGDVVYLSLEDNRTRMQNRLNLLGENMPEGLHFSYKAEKLGCGLLQQIEAEANKYDHLRLIVVDTLGRIEAPAQRGLDAYQSRTSSIGPLQQFAMNRNVCLLLIHHLKKEGVHHADDPFERLSGSLGLQGVADMMALIAGKREDRVKQFVFVGRDVSGDTFDVELGTDLRWHIEGRTEENQRERALTEFQNHPIVKTIISKTAKDAYGCTATELLIDAAQVTGVSVDMDARALGRWLAKSAGQLALIGIRYDPPATGGRKGRVHRFSKQISLYKM